MKRKEKAETNWDGFPFYSFRTIVNSRCRYCNRYCRSSRKIFFSKFLAALAFLIFPWSLCLFLFLFLFLLMFISVLTYCENNPLPTINSFPWKSWMTNKSSTKTNVGQTDSVNFAPSSFYHFYVKLSVVVLWQRTIVQTWIVPTQRKLYLIVGRETNIYAISVYV